MAAIDKNNCIEMRRGCILKALIVYPNEDPEDIIKEYLDIADSQEAMNQTTIGIIHEGAEPTDDFEDVGIIIEDVELIYILHNIANAFAVLFGTMYALNLSHPQYLRYTFEVLQKIVMELDGAKLSNKAQVLKNKLPEATA